LVGRDKSFGNDDAVERAEGSEVDIAGRNQNNIAGLGTIGKDNVWIESGGETARSL